MCFFLGLGHAVLEDGDEHLRKSDGVGLRDRRLEDDADGGDDVRALLEVVNATSDGELTVEEVLNNLVEDSVAAQIGVGLKV